MSGLENKRREERLSYQWPVLFAEDFTETVSQGVMVDVASGGMAFLCSADDNCPRVGQKLAMRFNIPRWEQNDPFAMTSFTRTGQVLRINIKNTSLRLVAVQFDQPLTLKPCEQVGIELMRCKNSIN